MKQRFLFIIRLYITLLLIFVTQKALFMLVNMGHADGATFGSCLAVLWHGLRLDSVTACYILAIPAIITLLSCFFRRFALRKVLMPYYVVVAILMTAIFVCDAVLYHFWGAKFDAAELFYASDPAEILANMKLWTVLVGTALVVALAVHYCRRLLHATTKVLDPLRSRWSCLSMALALGLVFLGMRGSVTQSTANPSYAYFSRYAFCNHAALNPVFNLIHSLFKTKDLTKEFNLMPIDEARQVVSPCFLTDGNFNDTLLTSQRPDILMIIWEGGGWQMVMNDSVAPNLMRYSHDGVNFTRCYANSFRTDRGVLSLLSGWEALPTTSLMKMNDKCSRLPGLAEELQKQGYSTRFIYGGDVDFTNMRGYLHEVGFATVGGSDDFPASRRLSVWGAPDAYTMLPNVLHYAQDSPSPRFDVLLTLSSHDPWEAPMQRLSDERLNAFCYTDSCLGVMLDSLRLSPQWDNLLVIIVPDHGVPFSTRQTMGDPPVAHIPMVWTGGAVRGHRDIDVMMNQSDIASTLLAQLGLPTDAFVFSRNVLSPTYSSLPHFALHSFKNGCNLFLDDGNVLRLDCTDISISANESDPTEEETHFMKALLQYIYQVSGEL